MTEAEARAAALELEGAVEGAHMGHPDFRVGGKIFATLWPDKARSVLRLPLELAESLEGGHRRIASRRGGGWLAIDLHLQDAAEFAELIALAHEFRRSG